MQEPTKVDWESMFPQEALLLNNFLEIQNKTLKIVQQLKHDVGIFASVNKPSKASTIPEYDPDYIPEVKTIALLFKKQEDL